jgi:hypothetical protein
MPIIRIIFLIAWSVFGSTGSAKVLQNDISLTKKELFPFPEVCRFAGVPDAPLIDSDIAALDCMGKKVKAIDFCAEKSKDPNLLRGYVDLQEKKVVCQSGERVILTIACETNETHYCQDAEKGCLELKKIFASRLSVVHTALLEDKDQKKIQCFYSSAAPREVDEAQKMISEDSKIKEVLKQSPRLQ